MTAPPWRSGALASLLLLSVLACHSPAGSASSAPEANSTGAEIIGGFPTESTGLLAVGSLGTLHGDTYEFFCTGTLVTPTLVLTAKHCAWGPSEGMRLDTAPIYFGVGPDAAHPLETVEANHVWISPETEGGMVYDGGGFGNDVALFKLVRPVEYATPIPVATEPLSEADLGQKFLSIGFGTDDANFLFSTAQPNTRRHMGTGTLRALDGLYFEHLFGSVEGLIAHEAALSEVPLPEDYIQWLKSTYEGSDLLPGYDAWLAREEGDVQPCFGDSGGPLLRRVPVTKDGATTSEFRVFGVVSGGWKSAGMACDYGTWYALPGPKVQELLASAAAYDDPCGSVSVRGACENNVATRCTKEPLEGVRRPSVLDCTSLGLVCALDGEQRATCMEQEESVPAPDETPSGAQIREALFRVTRAHGKRL